MEALEERTNGYGILRVRSGLGWVSVKSDTGSPILEEVDRFGRPISRQAPPKVTTARSKLQILQ